MFNDFNIRLRERFVGIQNFKSFKRNEEVFLFIFYMKAKAKEEEIMYNQISSLKMQFLAVSEIENTNSK